MCSFRLIQYTSRLVWHQLESRNANKYSVDRIKNLENNFGSFRKSKMCMIILLIHIQPASIGHLSKMHFDSPIFLSFNDINLGYEYLNQIIISYCSSTVGKMC